MSVFDEEGPKRKAIHEIGCDLSFLSVDELEARIEQIRQEIVRIELEIKSKSASKSAAEGLFKK